MVEIDSALDEAVRRREALAARLDEELCRPRPQDPVTADLASALAADPTADVGAEAAARLRKSRQATGAQEEALDAITTVVGDAMARVAAEIEHLEREKSDAARRRDEVWCEFVREAYAALLGEFRERWDALYAEVVAPMVALAELKAPNQAPGFNTNIVAGVDPGRITDDSVFKVRTREGIDYLFRGRDIPGPEVVREDLLAAFFGRLGAHNA
jgi:hypothetical protein